MSKYYSEKCGTSDLCCQVQPISNETAIRRVCKRLDTSSYFVCDTCESSISHEEQCVHSLVAKDGKFIKEQFSIRHFRRDKVSCCYLAQDTITEDCNKYNDNDTEIEKSIIQDKDENEDVVDCDSSDRENLCMEVNENTSSTTKLLSRSDLKRMFDKILGYHDRCNENVKIAICSLAISTKDISSSDGRICGIIGTDLCNTSFDLEQSIKTIIQEHKNSFMPSKGIYNPAKQNLLPTITQV